MNVLIICTGNICRSQLAAAYLSKLVKEYDIPDIKIDTAGVKAIGKKLRIPEGIKEAAQSNQLQLGGEFGKQITLSMLEQADFILVMEYAQASYLLDMHPDVLSKVKIIGKYDPQKSLNKEIRDPVSFDYKNCVSILEELKNCIQGFVHEEILNSSDSVVGRSDKQEDENPLYFDFEFD